MALIAARLRNGDDQQTVEREAREAIAKIGEGREHEGIRSHLHKELAWLLGNPGKF